MTHVDNKADGRIGGTQIGKVPSWLGLLGLAALSLLSVGCTGLGGWVRNGHQVGPDYCRPPAPIADAWIDGGDPRVLSQEADYSHWWNCFEDPVLGWLVAAAHEQNLSLREAGMRILEARARAAYARGTLFPQTQDAVGGYSHTQAASRAVVDGPQLTSQVLDRWEVGFNTTWELDFWGRFRRGIESADANWDATIEDYDSVLVLLQAEVASTYIRIRTFQERLALALENIQLQEKTLAVTDERARGGQTSRVDVAQATENLALTKALVPELRIGLRQSQNALCVLLGEPPQDLTGRLGAGRIPAAPANVAVGIPADLLRRRPDVRRAERLAAAQSARIGIAEADFYPRIAILGNVGWEASQFTDLLSPGSFTGTIRPGFAWSILNYGRIQNRVRAEEAVFYERVYEYQNAVLRANAETEDAIVRFLQEQERVQHLNDTVAASKRYKELVALQYAAGEATSLALVDSERLLRDRQDGWAQSRAAVALSLVAIYRALGGGWEMRYQPDAVATPAATESPAPSPPADPPPADPPSAKTGSVNVSG